MSRFALRLRAEIIPPVTRTLSPRERDIAWPIFLDWAKRGIIRPTSSPNPHNTLLVEKANGSFRWCIDYRPVNSATEEFEWPLPRIQDLRFRLGRSRWFFRIDLKDAFFRLRVEQSDGASLAFNTPWGVHTINRMAFGLKNAPAYFQRFMDHTLQGLRNQLWWYLDDVLGHTETEEECWRLWRKTRQTLLAAGCEINETKSQPPTTKLVMVGLHISAGRLGIGDRLAHPIPAPRTKKERQSALGLINYCRDFIPFLSLFTEAVTPNQYNDTRSGPRFDEAWDALMRQVKRQVELCQWSDDQPADLYADASKYAAGAVLMQDGRIVAIMSKKLTPSQTRYSATDREHYAIYLATKKFKCLTYRTTGETRVHTDHTALLDRKGADLTERQWRWNQTIHHWVRNLVAVKGEANPADFFSRFGGQGVWGPFSQTPSI